MPSTVSSNVAVYVRFNVAFGASGPGRSVASHVISRVDELNVPPLEMVPGTMPSGTRSTTTMLYTFERLEPVLRSVTV